MWDGSLNPAVIQAQINLSLAMAAAGSAAATRRPRQSRSALITPATRAGRRPRGRAVAAVHGQVPAVRRHAVQPGRQLRPGRVPGRGYPLAVAALTGPAGSGIGAGRGALATLAEFAGLFTGDTVWRQLRHALYVLLLTRAGTGNCSRRSSAR